MSKSIDATNSDPAPACGLAGVTCFAFDAAGNLAGLTDANGNLTDFAYDERERVTDRTDPLLNAETFSYDGNGNLRFVTDRKNQVTELRYDVVDRIDQQVLMPGTAEESLRDYGYDLMDNLTSVSDPDTALSFTYDLLDRLKIASTAGAPHQPATTLTYGYDKNDNRLSLDDGVIGLTIYNYDPLDRLDDMTPPGLGLIDFAYDPLFRRTLIDRPNGTTSTFTYDTASRLDTITHAAGVTTLASFDYDVDAVGKRTLLNQTRAAVPATPAITFNYDETDQVTGATAALTGGTDESYDYDALGNRTASHLSASHVTDAANRLLEDDSFCYGYDANGNLETKTAKLTGACTGAVTVYTWDVENRLVRIDLPGGSLATYKYDGLGRRVQKDVDGAVTTYVYDGADILLEYDGANSLLARYTHGAGIDEPVILERDLDGSGIFEATERFFYHTDGLGSVTELTDATGAVARTIVYDSYGRIAQDTGGVASPFAFTGRELDAESGLYFYRARYYDPSTGRFLSEDPIEFLGGDANFYRYVSNNTLNLNDPSGLIADIFVDIGFITYDIGELIVDNVVGNCDNLDENLAALGADVVGAFVPFGTGFGLATKSSIQALKAQKKLDKLKKLGKKAATSGGKKGSKMLENLAKKAGLKVTKGGKELKVATPDGTYVTSIPKSLKSKFTAEDIVKKIIKAAQ